MPHCQATCSRALRQCPRVATYGTELCPYHAKVAAGLLDPSQPPEKKPARPKK